MHRKAYAKLTFHLQVVGREGKKLRFQNLTVPIDLFDMVYVEKSPEMTIKTDKSYLPNDRRNTVYQAVTLMKNKYHIKDNFEITIRKNIPAQSGLGGGSADAAAVIQILNQMYALKMSDKEKIAIARQIDEDTPFCLFNKPSLVEGVGDILTPLSYHAEPLYYLLVKPPKGVSTKRFMRKYHSFQRNNEHLFKMAEAFENGQYKVMTSYLHNDFMDLVREKNKYIQKIEKDFEKLGLNAYTMSGSGSSVFAVSKSLEEVQRAQQKLVFKYPFVKYGRILC